MVDSRLSGFLRRVLSNRVGLGFDKILVRLRLVYEFIVDCWLKEPLELSGKYLQE